MALSAQSQQTLAAAIGHGPAKELATVVTSIDTLLVQVPGTTTNASLTGTSSSRIRAGNYSVSVSSAGPVTITSTSIIAGGGTAGADYLTIATGGIALGNGGISAAQTQVLTEATGDGTSAALVLTPTYSGAFTLDRHNYIGMNNVDPGDATVTSAVAIGFDAAAGTHKAVDSGSTKTSPGTVSAWVKVAIAGTIYYIPAYTSKTS